MTIHTVQMSPCHLDKPVQVSPCQSEESVQVSTCLFDEYVSLIRVCSDVTFTVGLFNVNIFSIILLGHHCPNFVIPEPIHISDPGASLWAEVSRGWIPPRDGPYVQIWRQCHCLCFIAFPYSRMPQIYKHSTKSESDFNNSKRN